METTSYMQYKDWTFPFSKTPKLYSTLTDVLIYNLKHGWELFRYLQLNIHNNPICSPFPDLNNTFKVISTQENIQITIVLSSTPYHTSRLNNNNLPSL